MIEAMKQALEALSDFDYDKRMSAITALRQAIAEAEKCEPVAWMRSNETCTDCFVWEKTDEHTIPLYTHPPKREWVGLTDEEMQEIALEVPMDAVRITEAKLRNKNQ